MTVGGRNAGSNYQNTILPSPLQLSFPVADIDIVGDLAWATAAIVGTQTAADGSATTGS